MKDGRYMFTKLKNFAKSNWSFAALVLLPLARLLWRAFVGSGKTPHPQHPTPIGDTYKKGDVIDVEAKK